MEYTQYLKSDDWKEKRTRKYQGKIRRCAICADNNNIQLHHLNYKKLYDIENSDLRMLCDSCHLLTHKLFKEGKIVFRSTNHHSRFAIIKSAVKKYLKITKVNMFKEQPKK